MPASYSMYRESLRVQNIENVDDDDAKKKHDDPAIFFFSSLRTYSRLGRGAK